MTEYSSLKVPELKKLLSEKGLSQTGNKADLVARLNDHDKASDAPAEDKPAAEEPKKQEPAKEDEISYSDEEAPAKTAPAEPAAAAPAAETKAEGEAAAAPPSGDKPAAEDAEESAPPPTSYAMGLASTAADDEAKKRADRAKRFGIEEDEESRRRAERSKRFGIDEKELASGLDSALPERPLKRGRGRDGPDGGRPGKRQSLDRRGGGAGRRRGGGREDRPAPARAAGLMDDPVERAKAEKRAARFAAA